MGCSSLPFAEMNIIYLPPVDLFEGNLSLVDRFVFFPGDLSKWMIIHNVDPGLRNPSHYLEGVPSKSGLNPHQKGTPDQNQPGVYKSGVKAQQKMKIFTVVVISF